MTITTKHIIKNYDAKSPFTPEFIIIHETANRSHGANAQAHYAYWNRDASARASAHFVVDDREILNLVPLTCVAWHIGDGGAKNPINNRNAIGIEICVNADGDYTRAVKNALMLTRYLMRTYRIPAANVLRHYDVSGKHCPATMLDTPALWTAFKASLHADPLLFLEDTASHLPTKLWDNTTYVPLRALCEALGHTVLWDADSGSVTVE